MKDPLLSLAPSELRAVSAAIRAGRINPVSSPLSIQQLIDSVRAPAVAARLTELSRAGVSHEGVAICLELAADALAARSPLEDLIDVVTTGPEAGGVANRSTSVVVSELFRNAEHSVLVAGYAIYQGQMVFQALAERMQVKPNLAVEMFLNVPQKPRDASSRATRLSRFANEFRTSHWPRGKRMPVVYACDGLLDGNSGQHGALHAKCIVVDERRVFVSSANFTAAAQERNIEVGVLLKSEAIAERLARFFRALIGREPFGRVI